MATVDQIIKASPLNTSGIFTVDDINYMNGPTQLSIADTSGMIVFGNSIGFFTSLANVSSGIGNYPRTAYKSDVVPVMSTTRCSGGTTNQSYPVLAAIDVNGRGYTSGSSGIGSLGRLESPYSAKVLAPFTGNAANYTWKTLRAGGTYSGIGVQTDGSMWSWGYGNNYQTGLGSTVNTTTPTRIGNLNTWANAWIGPNSNGFAIQSDGSLWSWGLNTGYLTSQGTNTGTTNNPTRVGSANDWLDAILVFGSTLVLAVKSDGTLWGVGSKSSGLAGDGTTSGNLTTFTRIGTDSDWSYPVGVGGIASALVKKDGTVWYSGNQAGIVGNTPSSSVSTWTKLWTPPSPIRSIDIPSATTGASQVLFAILENDELWASGYSREFPAYLPGWSDNSPSRTPLQKIADLPKGARLTCGASTFIYY